MYITIKVEHYTFFDLQDFVAAEIKKPTMNYGNSLELLKSCQDISVKKIAWQIEYTGK